MLVLKEETTTNMLRSRIKQYLKFQRHYLYVEKRVLKLRSEICSKACLYGEVDFLTRTLFMKYNTYLKKLNTIKKEKRWLIQKR